MEQILTLQTLESLNVYFDPIRQRILRELGQKPSTVQAIAERMDVPFKRLYYQFKLLEQHGLIAVAEVKNFSGAVDEKTYALTAARVEVAEHLLELQDSNPALEQVLDNTLGAAARDIRHAVADGLIDLRQPALLLEKRQLRLTKKQYERLARLLERELNQLEQSQDGEGFGFVYALYPNPS